MTPSNGTSSPVKKTGWSLTKEEGEEEAGVEAESESLASVRCKGLVMEFLLEMNFGAGFENCRGFVTVMMNLDGDEREEHFENMVTCKEFGYD